MAPRYTGSPYHKTRPSRWGPPVRPCSKTPCPPHVSDDEAVAVLERAIREGIERGHCSAAPPGAWPRYVWGRSNFASRNPEFGSLPVTWEAQCTNAQGGEYKAYPVDRRRHSDEMPPNVESLLWP